MPDVISAGEAPATSEVPAMPEEPTTTVVPSLRPDVERKAMLAQAVAKSVLEGWNVQAQTDFQAVMVKGKRTSHGLHLFLSIITLGAWLFVWTIVWYSNREQHLVIDVDPYGNVNLQQ